MNQPNDGIIGQTGPAQGQKDDQLQLAQQQRDELARRQQQIVEKFLGVCSTVGLLDSGNSRAALNKVVIDHAEVIVGSESFQDVVRSINVAKQKGIDRVYMAPDYASNILDDVRARVPSTKIWISMLSILGYTVIEKFGVDKDTVIAW